MRPCYRTILPAALLAPAAVLTLQAADADARIEAAIRESYNFRKALPGKDITVKSDGGLVTLSGQVPEEGDRALAGETALAVPGVREVRNELKAGNVSPVEYSDGWVTLKVKGALAFHKHVRASSTTVETRDGVVTLGGTARTRAEKDLATSCARDVDGVKEVRNLMKVSPDEARETLGERIDDASLTAQVKTALLLHRSTRGLATKVTTRRGVVLLRGQARSAAEKALAGRLAADTRGVRRVDNRLAVQPS